MSGSSTEHLHPSRAASIALLLTATVLGGSDAPRRAVGGEAAATAPAPDTTTGRTRVWMRNVTFHMRDSVILHIHSLVGTMQPVKGGAVNFDDPTSYVTEIASAQVGMTGPDLTRLMNRHLFAYRGAPLSHLRIELLHDELRQSGILHKGVPIPFDIRAQVRLTPQGAIELHPTSIRIFGVDGEALMKALHLSLAKMIDLSGARGVSVRGNDLFLDPTAILPPPAIRGRLASVRFSGNELLQVFGDTTTDSPTARPRALPDSGATNFMYYRGGSLHFGKLTMQDAEMLVVDLDPRDPFDFDNEHYQRQLIAGYSRTLPDLGLEVFMPDAGRAASSRGGIPPFASELP